MDIPQKIIFKKKSDKIFTKEAYFGYDEDSRDIKPVRFIEE